MKLVYHAFNKSIAGFKVYNSSSEYQRMMDAILFYQGEKRQRSLSTLMRARQRKKKDKDNRRTKNNGKPLINVIAFCLMPTHFHFILEEIKPKGVSKFLGQVLNSYTRYFNLRHRRKGPLWQGRSKKVLITDDQQLLQVTRFVHLNPVTAYLVDAPEQWGFSSYQQYIGKSDGGGLCRFDHLLEMEQKQYRRFVDDQIDYQRNLSSIKSIIFE